MSAQALHRVNTGGVYYQIFNSGVEKRVIFNDGEDYKVFLGYFNDFLTAPKDSNSLKRTFKVRGRIFRGTPHQPKNYFNKVELIAYSLTPDRFSLLLRQVTDGAIEGLVRSLCTRYAMYFNKKYQRTGSLFEGPYKSVQINEGHDLLELTRSLHRADGYSSYPEYLGSRETSWVRPEVVLSSLVKEKGSHSSYKDFVEKYQLDQKVKGLIDGTTFDDQTDQLERSPEAPLKRINPANRTEIRTDPDLKIRSRMPEFLITSTLIFVLLVGIGVRNTQVSSVANDQSPPPAVLAKTETIPAATLEATSGASLEATSTAKSEIVESLPKTKAKSTVIVKIDDGSSTVNIRQKPTTNSEKVGQAQDGDTFELVSLNSEWYEIRLTDESTGFISKEYAVINGGNN